MGLVAGAVRGTECEVGQWRRALPGDVGRQRGGGPGWERAPGPWELLSQSAAVHSGYIMFKRPPLWRNGAALRASEWSVHCLHPASPLLFPQPLLWSVCPPDSPPQLSVPCWHHYFVLPAVLARYLPTRYAPRRCVGGGGGRKVRTNFENCWILC